MAHLPTQMATDFAEIVDSPPASKPYTKMKNLSIEGTAFDVEQNILTLVSGILLGDRTSSQLVGYMKQLVGTQSISEPILK